MFLISLNVAVDEIVCATHTVRCFDRSKTLYWNCVLKISSVEEAGEISVLLSMGMVVFGKDFSRTQRMLRWMLGAGNSLDSELDTLNSNLTSTLCFSFAFVVLDVVVDGVLFASVRP